MAETSGRGSLLSQAGPLLLGRGGVALLSFSLPLALTRLLPVAEYGTYKALFLVVTTAYFILQAGLAISLYYFVPQRPERARVFFTHSLLGCALLGGLGAVAIFCGRGLIAQHFGSPDLFTHGVWMALLAFTMVATVPLEAQLMAEGNARGAALTGFCSEAVRVGASIVPLALGLGLRGLLIANALHGLGRLCWCARALAQRGGPEVDRALLRIQLAYTMPFAAATLLEIPQKTFHQYAVGWAVSPAQFAIYMVGCFQIPIINLLYAPISDIVMVRLSASKRQREDGQQLFREANARLAAAFFPLTAGLFAAGALLVPALFTHQYDESVPLFRIAILTIPFAALPLDSVLRALGKTRYLFSLFFVKLALTIPAVLLGLRLGGMLGAIAAQSAIEAVIRLSMLERVRKELGTTWAALLPWQNLTQLGAAALVACGPVWAISQRHATDPRPWLALCEAGALYLATYLGALAIGPGSPILRLRRVLLGHTVPAEVMVATSPA